MHQFIWRPYINFLPNDYDDNIIWSATTSMICFYIIDMHQTDNVKHQFGYLQQILSTPRCLTGHHKMDMTQARKFHCTTLNKEEQDEWEKI